MAWNVPHPRDVPLTTWLILALSTTELGHTVKLKVPCGVCYSAAYRTVWPLSELYQNRNSVKLGCPAVCICGCLHGYSVAVIP